MIDLRVNRANDLFRQAFDELSVALKPELTRRSHSFTYLIGDTGTELAAARSKSDRVLTILDAPLRNELANKGKLALALKGKGINGLFPPTYFSVEEALSANSTADMWFVKNRHGAGGKSMRCLTSEQLKDCELGPYDIIQEGVADVSLVDDRKFTARIYLFIWNRQVFLYREGFMVMHGTPYDRNSTDYKVQIDHSGYFHGKNNIDLAPLSWHAHYRDLSERYETAAIRLLPVLARAVAASSNERYLMLGIDTLVTKSGGVNFIEINAVPNFVHTDEINQLVNVPFFKACIMRIFGLPAHDLTELI